MSPNHETDLIPGPPFLINLVVSSKRSRETIRVELNLR
jgi:hypothetical protein